MRHLVAALVLGIFVLQSALAAPPTKVVGEDIDYIAEEETSLLELAEKFSLAIEHIAFANGLPESSTKVVEGSVLRIPQARILPLNPPKTGLVLNVPERGIYFFRDGKFVRFIPVSVGRPPEAKTPLGEFRIIDKVKDPTWYPPKSVESKTPVPPGPDNPLGNRWIGLSAPSVGIHGTNDPLNVGAPVTKGCIRCYPLQVEKLFEEVSVGMPVRIEYVTAKLGKLDSGEVVLATFPDIYGTESGEEVSQKLLTAAGYGSLNKDARFQGKVKLNLGYALSLDQAKKLAREITQNSAAAPIPAPVRAIETPDTEGPELE